MKKIPTIFVRDMSKQPALVTSEWRVGCEWVRDGEGRATLKHDGTSCLVRDGKLYKRRELKPGQTPPPEFELSTFDEETQKSVGWVPVGDGPDDKYHREAVSGKFDGPFNEFPNGTYELMGPKIQGNKSGYPSHVLIAHGSVEIDAPRDYETLRELLRDTQMEGLVWHHPDGRMAKIKRRDFGWKW